MNMCINLDFLLNGQFVVYCYQCILLFYSNHGSICFIKVWKYFFSVIKKKKKLVQNDNGISFSVYVNLKNVIISNTQESRVVHVVHGLIESRVLCLWVQPLDIQCKVCNINHCFSFNDSDFKVLEWRLMLEVYFCIDRRAYFIRCLYFDMDSFKFVWWKVVCVYLFWVW